MNPLFVSGSHVEALDALAIFPTKEKRHDRPRRIPVIIGVGEINDRPAADAPGPRFGRADGRGRAQGRCRCRRRLAGALRLDGDHPADFLSRRSMCQHCCRQELGIYAAHTVPGAHGRWRFPGAAPQRCRQRHWRGRSAGLPAGGRRSDAHLAAQAGGGSGGGRLALRRLAGIGIGPAPPLWTDHPERDLPALRKRQPRRLGAEPWPKARPRAATIWSR